VREQYRAVLIDPGKPAPDRPIETLTNSLHNVEQWAVATLVGSKGLQGPTKIQTSDQAKVEVYVTREEHLTTYDKNQARAIRRQLP